MREEIRLSIERQTIEQLGRGKAIHAGLKEVLSEAEELGWIRRQVQETIGSVVRRINQVEEQIEIMAFYTTDENMRHTLAWYEGEKRVPVIIGDQEVWFPRPIVCVLPHAIEAAEPNPDAAVLDLRNPDL